MTHAHSAPRKVPKWVLTPGVIVAFLVLVPGFVRAPFEDIAPSTQTVMEGYANGTFAQNISASDDTYIVVQTENVSFEQDPRIWTWNATIFYNWTGVNTTGDRWQLLIECRAVGPDNATNPQNELSWYEVVVPPLEYGDIDDVDWQGGGSAPVRLTCPDSYTAPDPEADVWGGCTAWCLPPYGPYMEYNLSEAELNGGAPSVIFFTIMQDCEDTGGPTCLYGPPDDPSEFFRWIDTLVLRRVWTVPAPPPAAPLDEWVISILLLILWIAFGAIGLGAPSGALSMVASLCGIFLSLLYIVPTDVPAGIAILGLAIVHFVAGIGIFIEAGQ